MKGQYFLVISLLFAAMFFSAIYTFISPESIIESEHRDVYYFYKSILKEYPYAFDDGINRSNINNYLVNFTVTSKNVAREGNMNMYALWLYTINRSSDINVTIGNFMNDTLNVTLNLSGDVKIVHVEKNSINSTVFTNPADKFNLTVTFYNIQTNLLLGKYKYNFYSYVEVGRRRALFKGDVIA